MGPFGPQKLPMGCCGPKKSLEIPWKVCRVQGGVTPTSYNWGEITPISRVTNTSYPFIFGHL